MSFQPILHVLPRSVWFGRLENELAVMSERPSDLHRIDIALRMPSFNFWYDGNTIGSRQVITCPMHPEIIRATPGTCPKCGMDLEPPNGTCWVINVLHSNLCMLGRCVNENLIKAQKRRTDT